MMKQIDMAKALNWRLKGMEHQGSGPDGQEAAGRTWSGTLQNMLGE